MVLFCGGQGLRLRGAVGSLPKPMVPVGGRPLLWHIMRYYAHYGHRDFVLCLGHQARVIEQYFARARASEGWRIEFVDTGIEASIGERFAAVRSLMRREERFLANYGDTVTDVSLPRLLENHSNRGKVASLLSVRPNYAFNVVSFEDGAVTGFHDITDSGVWINGGYFVFRGDVFDYVEGGEDMPEILGRLIDAGELVTYPYEGFWAPMDTLKDKQRLEALVASGGSVWQVWEAPAPAAVAVAVGS